MDEMAGRYLAEPGGGGAIAVLFFFFCESIPFFVLSWVENVSCRMDDMTKSDDLVQK
jgi:hypothetical protein